MLCFSHWICFYRSSFHIYCQPRLPVLWYWILVHLKSFFLDVLTFFHKLVLFEMFVGLKILNFHPLNSAQEIRVLFLTDFLVQIYQHLYFYLLVLFFCHNQFMEFLFQNMDLLYNSISLHFLDLRISLISQGM